MAAYSAGDRMPEASSRLVCSSAATALGFLLVLLSSDPGGDSTRDTCDSDRDIAAAAAADDDADGGADSAVLLQWLLRLLRLSLWSSRPVLA